MAAKLTTLPVPRRLSIALSRDEVSRLVLATHCLKYKAAFSVTYGEGLRISEVVGLKIRCVVDLMSSIFRDIAGREISFQKIRYRGLNMPLQRVFRYLS